MFFLSLSCVCKPSPRSATRGQCRRETLESRVCARAITFCCLPVSHTFGAPAALLPWQPSLNAQRVRICLTPHACTPSAVQGGCGENPSGRFDRHVSLPPETIESVPELTRRRLLYISRKINNNN